MPYAETVDSTWPRVRRDNNESKHEGSDAGTNGPNHDMLNGRTNDSIWANAFDDKMKPNRAKSGADTGAPARASLDIENVRSDYG